MNEIWKDIKDYEGLYQVSNLGRVYSSYYNKILKPTIVQNGYYVVCLRKNKKQKNMKVHRLVAQAFIENPNKLSQVNHKDENKLNNIVDNLEWCTPIYNSNYGTGKFRRGLLSRKPIIQLDMNGTLIKEYKSMKDASKCGFQQASISRCCNGNQSYHKGFIWRYYL